jgi:electron transport complex protein RnfE
LTNTKKLWIFLKGLIVENPVLVLVLGTCPALAVSTSIVSAISMGIAATLVLICSNVVISLLRNIIPDTVRIPAYIVVIATFVTLVQMLLQAYLPGIYELLGVYLALIVVNCIILGRAEVFARKNRPLDSLLDGLGMGLGFLIALLAMAVIREILGTGTINLSALGLESVKIPYLSEYNIPLLAQAPGGFLVFGILIAIVNKIGPKKGESKRKNFSCEGCPSASICGKIACSDLTELTTEITIEAEAAAEENKNREEGV